MIRAAGGPAGAGNRPQAALLHGAGGAREDSRHVGSLRAIGVGLRCVMAGGKDEDAEPHSDNLETGLKVRLERDRGRA